MTDDCHTFQIQPVTLMDHTMSTPNGHELGHCIHLHIQKFNYYVGTSVINNTQLAEYTIFYWFSFVDAA